MSNSSANISFKITKVKKHVEKTAYKTSKKLVIIHEAKKIDILAVVYYFGISVPFIFHSNSLLTLDQDSLDIYSFFMADETHSNLASIFNNKDTNQDNVNDY